MSSRKDERTGNWFYRKWVLLPSGKRTRIFGAADEAGQPFHKKSEADAAEREAIERLKQPAKRKMPTFDEWFNGRFWLEWVLGGPRGANSPAEQESKTLRYGKWIKEPFGDLPLDRIDVEVINGFRARLRGLKRPDGERQLAEKTVNNILAIVSTPLQYAEKCGLLTRAPHVGVAKVERPDVEFLEFEEFYELLAAAQADGPTTVLAVLLAYEAGMRIGEIRALVWEQLDMRARTITVDRQARVVRHADGKYRDTEGKPKGRRRRVVTMTPRLHAALADRIRVGHVIGGEGGKRRTKEEYRALAARLGRITGLGEKISGWHIGRHTFGMHCALLGANPWLLQEWMGHARLEETQIYANLARAHGRAIPREVVTAGADLADLADPTQRLLAQLAARGTAEGSKKRAAVGHRSRGGKK